MEVPEYLIKAIIKHYKTMIDYYETKDLNNKILVNASNARRLGKQELTSLRNILNKHKKNNDQ